MEIAEFAALFTLGFIGLFITLDILLANEFFSIAKQKGYNDKKYFLYCLLCGIAGYLLVIALPPKTK